MGFDLGDARDVSVLNCMQTVSGVHPASYLVATGGSF
jgi:hypothetical protein